GPSRNPEQAGIFPAMIGTIFICAVCACFAVPLGVGTAVLLEEFKPRNRFLRRLHGFVQLNITNLAGVPSVVYGILGLTAFVQMFNLFGSPNEPAFAIGQRWFDYAMDEGGQGAYIDISGRDAPETILSGDLRFLDVDGEPRDITLVAPEDIEDQVYDLEDRAALVTDTLLDRMDADEPVTAEDLQIVLTEALAEAEIESIDVAMQSTMIDRVLSSYGAESREQRRALRNLEKDFIASVKADAFAGMLRTDAAVNRSSDERPWYLQFPFGRGVFAGGLTLMLVVLPVIIIASQESLRAVPDSLRQGALALGATRWQMIREMTLPAAIPGIMTGTILAMSRAIGEAAPILIIAGVVYITFTPSHLMDDFTAMPLQIFDWASRPREDFHQVAASGIIVLLVILLMFNGIAVYIRNRFQKPLS
ncbi:MAG: ABC transporter permease subunit, partial [Planctomycetota bacterium]